MAFAGTKMRGSACGCCQPLCGVCNASGPIPFCIRFSGIVPDDVTDCYGCDALNATFGEFDQLVGSFVFVECGAEGCNLNTSCEQDEMWELDYQDKKACYIATFSFFGACGINFAALSETCRALGEGTSYWLRAFILKPTDPDVTPGTTEVHFFIYRFENAVGASGDVYDLLLHTKYVFPSVPFDCTTVDWTEAEVVAHTETSTLLECDWSSVVMEFRFSEDCQGSPVADDPCCGETTLPSVLLMTTSGSSDDRVDFPLGDVPTAEGFQYSNSDGSSLWEMICSSGTTFISVNTGGSNVNVPLTILSCDPFHAVGINAGIEVEITQ